MKKCTILIFTALFLGALTACGEADKAGEAEVSAEAENITEAVYDYNDSFTFDDTNTNTVIIGGSSVCAYEDDGEHLFKKCGWSEFYGNYETDSNIINISAPNKTLADFSETGYLETLSENLKQGDEILLQIEPADYEDSALTEEVTSIIDTAEADNVKFYLILPFYTYSDETAQKINEELYDLAAGHNFNIIPLQLYSWLSASNTDRAFSDSETKRMEQGLSCYIDKDLGFDYEGYNEIFADIAACTIYNFRSESSEGINLGEYFSKLDLSYSVTRGMFTDSLVKLCGFDSTEGDNFSDVAAGSEYYDSILTAKNLGLVEAYSDGTFHPDENITLSDIYVTGMNFLRYADNKYEKSYFDETNANTGVDSDTARKSAAEVTGVEAYAAAAAYDWMYYGLLVSAAEFNMPDNMVIMDMYRFFYNNIYTG